MCFEEELKQFMCADTLNSYVGICTLVMNEPLLILLSRLYI